MELTSMKAKDFQIKSFVMQSGERYCLLVASKDSMPLFYPNLYVTTQVRNKSNSVAAMESALLGINVLLSFCEDNEIDLIKRFLKREFFTLSEMDAIRDYCQISLGNGSLKQHDPKVREIKEAKIKKKPTRKVGRASEYIRLSHIAKYVEWLATILLEGAADQKSMLDVQKMKKGFQSRRPSKQGRNQDRREKGLTNEQEKALLEVIRIGSPQNPFIDESTQVRNELIILLLLHLGIRSGELLNIKVSDIDWARNEIIIARRRH